MTNIFVRILFVLIIINTGVKHVLSQESGNKYIINDVVVNSSEKIDPDYFNSELFRLALFDEINNLRLKKGNENFFIRELFNDAANAHAKYLAQENIITLAQKDKIKRTTSDRLIFYGGSKNGVELVTKSVISKRGKYYSYKKIAEDIAFKWFVTKKTLKLINNPKYSFIGIGSALDEIGNNIYVSAVFGNYISFNNGAERRNELKVPYTDNKFGLKPYNESECKKCKRFNNIEELQKGLYIENNKIYFKYNNLKLLKKLLRNPKDAIAVDIVQKTQYPCKGENIIDYNLFNKGVLLKRIYAPKLFKKNLIEGKKIKTIKVYIDDFPFEIKGDYELNLIIIKNKHFCKNISQTFIYSGNSDFSKNIELLADTIEINSDFNYRPIADSAVLHFRIPFEKKKFTYKTADIKPFLKSLNEPDFIINELSISAFSSIEGTKEENKILRQKRAESIVKAIKKLQKEDIISDIITGDSWEQFKNDVYRTEFDKLATMSLDDARKYINRINISRKLENILSKHRYAQIDMKVIYDVEGNKEESFVINQFNKAINENDLPLALSIQKYIFKKILNNKYSDDAVFNQNIPEETNFAGLLMNKLWLEIYIEQADIEDYWQKIEKLKNLEPTNNYILFNYLLCEILFNEIGDERKISDLQNLINELYLSSFSIKTIDALNVKYQLKIIKSLKETNPDSKIITESLRRLKKIINIKGENMENSLKLAYLFIDHKDYEYAIRLIEPFVERHNVSEELLFTYISLCSFSQHRTFSDRFVRILQKAKELNQERYCELFDGSKFSFQVFENPNVKKIYCESCKH
ncbi:MAG: hypothetical protein KAT68_08635 [Bacteroidales bacterium]|nr:hypothetical protein [Bacteroidales bacterium]